MTAYRLTKQNTVYSLTKHLTCTINSLTKTNYCNKTNGLIETNKKQMVVF